MASPGQAALRLYRAASASLQSLTESRGLLLLLLASVWLTLQLVLLPMLSLTPPLFPSSLAPSPAQATSPLTPDPASLALAHPFDAAQGAGRFREGAAGEARSKGTLESSDGERGPLGAPKVRGMGTIRAYSKFSQPANGLTVSAGGDSDAGSSSGSGGDKKGGGEATAGGMGGRETEGAGPGHTEGSNLPSPGSDRVLGVVGEPQPEAGAGAEGAAYPGYAAGGGGPRRLGARRGQGGKRSVGKGRGAQEPQGPREGQVEVPSGGPGVSQKISQREDLPGFESALLAAAESQDLPRVPEILGIAKQVYLGNPGVPGGIAQSGQGQEQKGRGKEGGPSGAASSTQRIPAVPSIRLPLPPHLLLSPSFSPSPTPSSTPSPSSSSSPSPSSTSTSSSESPSFRPLLPPHAWPSPLDSQHMPPLPHALPDSGLLGPHSHMPHVPNLPHMPPVVDAPDLAHGGDATDLPAAGPAPAVAKGESSNDEDGSKGASSSGDGSKEDGNSGDGNKADGSKGDSNKENSNTGDSNKGDSDKENSSQNGDSSKGDSNKENSNKEDSNKEDGSKGDLAGAQQESSSGSKATEGEEALPAECKGKRVYVYDTLPAAFEDIVTNCNAVCLEKNRERLCTNLPRDGLGRDFGTRNFSHSYGGVRYDFAPWLPTEQHMLGVLFNARVRGHACRTRDWEKADVFYIPALFGVMELCGGFEMIDDMTDRLEAYLAEQPGYKRRGGADHFAVVGQQVYSFTRGGRNATGYGAYLLARPSLAKVLFVLVERMSWDEQTHSVPYPTAFHPGSEEELHEWVRFVEGHPRETLVSMASGSRDGVRAAVIDACKNSNGNSSRDSNNSEGSSNSTSEGSSNSTSNSNSSSVSVGDSTSGSSNGSTSQACKFVDCRKDCPYNFCFSDRGFCADPRTVSTLHLSSHFCLQPPGDSHTRRSIFDALIAGCIPVFFTSEAFEKQYQWHFPQDRRAISLLFDGEKVKDGSLDFMKALRSIPAERIQEMRRNIVALIPQLLFKDHTRAQPGFAIRDAFDFALEGITTTLKGRNQ